MCRPELAYAAAVFFLLVTPAPSAGFHTFPSCSPISRQVTWPSSSVPFSRAPRSRLTLAVTLMSDSERRSETPAEKLIVSEYSRTDSKHFDEFVNELPSMAGRTVAITGCTVGGMGFITAATVLRLGGDVIMLNRKSKRAKTAFDILRDSAHSSQQVSSVPCDLSSFESVRQAAARIFESIPGGIQVLCNNGGVAMVEGAPAEDGFDLTMTVNHLSHVLLTQELLPLLELGAVGTQDSRIVFMSSESRKVPGTAIDKAFFSKGMVDLGGAGEQGMTERYHQSKLAMSLYWTELAARCGKKKPSLKVLMAHPGLAVTRLADTVYEPKIESDFSRFYLQEAQSAQDGAMGLLKCICSEDVQNGEFWGPRSSDPDGMALAGPAERIPPEAMITDEKARQGVWRWSVEAIGGLR